MVEILEIKKEQLHAAPGNYIFLEKKEYIPNPSVIKGNISHNEPLSKKSENSFTKIIFFEIYMNIKKELTSRIASTTLIVFLRSNAIPPRIL